MHANFVVKTLDLQLSAKYTRDFNGSLQIS